MDPLPIREKIQPFESLMSLVFRLTEANVYEHPGRILNGLAESPKNFSTQNNLNNPDTMRILSSLNKCSEADIFSTTSHRFTKFLSHTNSSTMDSNTIENYVRHSSTQYCPLCVNESNYHRIYWDILPVTICLKHKVLLQNTCPSCNHPVTVYSILRNKCSCRKDLLTVNLIDITPYPEAIRNQIFIQNLLEINESGYSDNATQNVNSPAMDLSPPDFFRALKLFSIVLNKLPESSRFLRLGDMTSNPLEWINQKRMVSNLTNLILINSATSILLEWPQKFYEFLDEYSTVDRAKRRTCGVQKAFGGLGELLFDKLDTENFGFIHSAYSNYLNEHWNGGHLSANISHLDLQDTEIQKKHITINESALILGIEPVFIQKLIKQNIIQAIVFEIKTKNRYIVNVDSVYALKRKVDSMLSPEDLSERLDLNIKTVKSLVKGGFLSPYTIRPWSPAYSYHFEPETVEQFEQEFLSEEKHTVVDKKPDGYFTATETVNKVANTMIGIDTSKLLHLVREGIFNPILCKEGKGLSRLLFNENEIRDYRDTDTVQKRDDNKLSVYRTGVILGIDMRLAQYLIDVGLITAITEDVDGEHRTYILKEDLDKFLEEYLFIEEAADMMGFITDTVFQWIKQGRLRDYSGIPITKRTSIRILRREEIKPLMAENSMDVPEAAEYLNLSTDYVRALIRKKVLPTLKGKGLGKSPFNRIPRNEIIQYKEWVLQTP